MLLEERSEFEMDIGPWISMRKWGRVVRSCCCAGRLCAQSKGVWVHVILGKASLEAAIPPWENRLALQAPPAL